MTQQINLNNLSQDELVKLAEGMQVLEQQRKYNKLAYLWPEAEHSKYKKHMLFMKAGSLYRERALIAGNRVGKTYLSMSEVAYHLTGKYPTWWQGKRFNTPIRVWCVGKTHETTRDILQKYLMGSRYELGTGFIPRDDIVKATTKHGVSEGIQDVYIKHYTNGVEDGVSELSFKSYVQGVEAFMGEHVHVVALDEEPENTKIYYECLTRTMTTQGIVLCTFTPLNGLSEVVLSFLPGGKFPKGGMGEVENEP